MTEINRETAVAILEQFRRDAQAELERMKAAGDDPAYIELVKELYAKHEASLSRFTLDISQPDEGGRA